jgi:hypothetical protein
MIAGIQRLAGAVRPALLGLMSIPLGGNMVDAGITGASALGGNKVGAYVGKKFFGASPTMKNAATADAARYAQQVDDLTQKFGGREFVPSEVLAAVKAPKTAEQFASDWGGHIGGITGAGLGLGATAVMGGMAQQNMNEAAIQQAMAQSIPPAFSPNDRLAIDTDYQFDRIAKQQDLAKQVYRRALDAGDYQLADAIASGQLPVSQLGMGY